jgi:formylglycine-generating enzyme required for sulfatase activity
MSTYPWLSLVVVLAALSGVCAAGEEDARAFVNSVEMKFVSIPAGLFTMGQAEGGEADERPIHQVTVSKPLFLAATEVTNAQYEQFDAAHKKLRGARGLSKDDDEAVVFVSWEEATAFCKWLSQKEGKPYRLPTEAEWEYACRAGTTTPYCTGQALPQESQKNQKFGWNPSPVSLAVGKTPANAWGLHDMHGNVEEWCLDWYGPYEAADQTDPVGPESGDMKVSRGGSHNTDLAFLRSANRSGTLPPDRSWLIGFRVAMGEMPSSKPLPPPAPPRWAQDVRQTKAGWKPIADATKPYFGPLRTFVHIPPGSNGPLYSKHNHCPSVTWCENGDLLAVWFSTNTEAGREMTILASRLRAGAEEWDPASVFFKAPDRNMTGSALYNDGHGTLYHFNGLEAGAGWANLALVLRTGKDNGASWESRLIQPDHQPRNQVISGILRTRKGVLIQPCDAVWGGNGGTAIHVSRDGGQTWNDPGAGTPKPRFEAGASGAMIAGIHAGVVELLDGRLMAFGRGDSIRGQSGPGPAMDDRMPMSISSDLGKTWTYAASPFRPLSGGQRLVLARLREGPLLFCCFTDPSSLKQPRGMAITDASGKQRAVFGLFAALSEDDGKTWPFRRLITDDGPDRTFDGGAWTRNFTMDVSHAEPKGYLCFTQTPDGIIHLLSSALHYRFNLAWLKTPPPPAEERKP